MARLIELRTIKLTGLGMVDVRELLKYNQEVRHRYFETFAKLSWEEFTKNMEASFHSIKNIFLHTLEAIDYWLSFLQKKDFRAHKKFDEYESIEEVKSYMEHVEKRMSNYLNSLSPAKLNEPYTANDDNGMPVEVTAEDVLIHVFEEEVHHRGELIALLWQLGVEPPLMSWKGI
jgi:uncharacterized damage-inducible protein DinB